MRSKNWPRATVAILYVARGQIFESSLASGLFNNIGSGLRLPLEGLREAHQFLRSKNESRATLIIADRREGINFAHRGRMAELAYAIALGAIGETLGGSTPLPPIKFLLRKNFTPSDTKKIN